MKKMRVGIVGAGNIARSGHLPAYKELRDIAEVTAIADLNEERAKEAAQLFNVPRWYGSAEALLEHEDVQLIDVCVHRHSGGPGRKSGSMRKAAGFQPGGRPGNRARNPRNQDALHVRHGFALQPGGHLA